MLKDFFSISVNSMKKRKLRSWLTLLGIFIGIAAVVSLISLGEGLRTAITGQFATLSADTLIVQNAETGFGPPGSTAIKKLTSHDLKLIENVRGAVEVILRNLRIGKIEYNKILSFNYVASMPENKKKLDFIYQNLNVELESGKFLENADYGKVLLGNDIANNPEFDKKIRTGSRLNIQGKDFEVIGILKKASSFQVNIAILMLDKDMNNIFNIKDEIDFIVIRAESKDKVTKLAEDIANVLRKDRKEKKGEEDFTIQTPLQALQAVNTILNIINIIVIGIAAISLLIGAIGIANTMYTSVLERTKEIGVMKAIGAKNSDILKIFAIESGILGLIGGILGILVGILTGKIIEYIAINQLQTNLLRIATPWYLIVGCLLFAFIIGSVSGFLPARQASKIKPADTLRYE